MFFRSRGVLRPKNARFFDVGVVVAMDSPAFKAAAECGVPSIQKIKESSSILAAGFVGIRFGFLLRLAIDGDGFVVVATAVSCRVIIIIDDIRNEEQVLMLSACCLLLFLCVCFGLFRPRRSIGCRSASKKINTAIFGCQWLGVCLVF